MSNIMANITDEQFQQITEKLKNAALENGLVNLSFMCDRLYRLVEQAGRPSMFQQVVGCVASLNYPSEIHPEFVLRLFELGLNQDEGSHSNAEALLNCLKSIIKFMGNPFPLWKQSYEYRLFIYLFI